MAITRVRKGNIETVTDTETDYVATKLYDFGNNVAKYSDNTGDKWEAALWQIKPSDTNKIDNNTAICPWPNEDIVLAFDNKTFATTAEKLEKEMKKGKYLFAIDALREVKHLEYDYARSLDQCYIIDQATSKRLYRTTRSVNSDVFAELMYKDWQEHRFTELNRYAKAIM